MIYVFGDCALDVQRRVMYRAGQVVRLRRKVFEALTYLLTARDRAVSKEELCQAVWTQLFISDAALETTIRAVRRAIGESGRAPTLLQTVHGYGYRFVAAVEERSDARADPASEARLTPPDVQSVRPMDNLDLIPSPVPSAGVADGDAQGVTDARDAYVPVLPEGMSRRDTPTSAGEWKVVTVLCCALADATAGSVPQQVAAQYRQQHALYTLTQEVMQEYGGTLLPVMGAHVLAIFGAPIAQEDHAPRAVLAALTLRQRLRDATALRQRAPGDGLGVRIGLHTGRVAVGGMSEASAWMGAVVEETVTQAAALPAQAGSGIIWCSAATARLVQEVVRLTPMGALPIVEGTTPMPAYMVLGRRALRRPLAWKWRLQTPFVGRRRELATLQALLEQVRAGRGQVVGVMGEPGIGKTRLLHEFRSRLRERTVTYLAANCLSHSQATPYLPIVTMLRQNCGLLERDSPEVVTAKVCDGLREVGMAPEQWSPYLLQLFGVAAGTERLAMLSPQLVKARTVETLVQMSLHGAQRRPLVVEVENLHWIDPSSEEVLGALVERLAGARILLLLTYRPGYRPLWMDKSYATQLALTPLNRQDSRRVVRALLRTRALPEPTFEAIIARADGNPLFLEELAHTAVEGTHASPQTVIPATLQAVLAARIDRLVPEAKRLLQVAAVIDKDIPLSLLQAVVELPAELLQQHLHHLETAELLYETAWTATPTLTFKHVLIQEAAYQSLVEETRQQLHRQIAQILVERFPDTVEQRPEVLASHYMAAGLPHHAVAYWQRAGERAIAHSAYPEAIAHLTQGIAVLDSLPPTRERLQQELAMQTALGPVLIFTRGYTAQEVEHTYLRAQELCQQLGETPQHFPVLFGLGVFYLVRAQYQTVHTLAEQLLLLAQRSADTSLHLEAHGLFGVNYYCRGAMVQAREHFEQALTYYDDAHSPHPHTFAYSREPGIACQAYLALILWWLGYPEQAATRSQLALSRAHALAHPATLVYVASFAARLHQLRHEVAQTEACLETVCTLAAAHGFPFWAARATILHGWVLTAQGHAEAGIAALRQGIDACRALGAAQWEPSWLTLLAEAYRQAGQAHVGLVVIAEALERVQQSGEHTEEAELYRLQGELLLLQATQQGEHDLITEATRYFHHARELAQRQGAKMWELRAVLSLCRLLQTQGQGTAAQHLLADTYQWFREGFDTRDLQAAQTLLADM